MPHHLLEDAPAKTGKASHELLMTVARLPHPATLDEIWKTPPLDQRHRVTVYKLLKRFEAAGLVRRIHLQGQRHKFELVSVRGFTDYLLCLRCQLLRDLGPNDVHHLKTACEEHHPGWNITRHELKFYGVCPDCQSPSPPSVSKVSRQAHGQARSSSTSRDVIRAPSKMTGSPLPG